MVLARSWFVVGLKVDLGVVPRLMVEREFGCFLVSLRLWVRVFAEMRWWALGPELGLERAKLRKG